MPSAVVSLFVCPLPFHANPFCRHPAPLLLKRAAASRPSGDWNEDDYDVLADGVAIGRIMHAAAAPVGSPWVWT
jgi:hypothetical protein